MSGSRKIARRSNGSCTEWQSPRAVVWCCWSEHQRVAGLWVLEANAAKMLGVVLG